MRLGCNIVWMWCVRPCPCSQGSCAREVTPIYARAAQSTTITWNFVSSWCVACARRLSPLATRRFLPRFTMHPFPCSPHAWQLVGGKRLSHSPISLSPTLHSGRVGAATPPAQRCAGARLQSTLSPTPSPLVPLASLSSSSSPSSPSSFSSPRSRCLYSGLPSTHRPLVVAVARLPALVMLRHLNTRPRPPRCWSSLTLLFFCFFFFCFYFFGFPPKFRARVYTALPPSQTSQTTQVEVQYCCVRPVVHRWFSLDAMTEVDTLYTRPPRH
jgi:hypothetical protein